MMEAAHDLPVLRVLVVEDEFLVSMLIEEMCADLGHEVVGPAATLEEGLALCETAEFEVALVDMNLGGVKADPILAELHERSIPFAIASGGGDGSQDGRATAVLGKPFVYPQLAQCLEKLASHLPTNGSASVA